MINKSFLKYVQSALQDKKKKEREELAVYNSKQKVTEG